MASRAKREQGPETFEELYSALEEHARRLEQGNLPLEDSLKLYEEGAAIADRLRELLEAAELRIRTVQGRVAAERIELREVEAGYDTGPRDDSGIDEGYGEGFDDA